MSDGVRKYRANDRSVEGLTEEELGDILEEFPDGSDAYRKALNQLEHIWDMEERYNEEPSKKDLINYTGDMETVLYADIEEERGVVRTSEDKTTWTGVLPSDEAKRVELVTREEAEKKAEEQYKRGFMTVAKTVIEIQENPEKIDEIAEQLDIDLDEELQ